MGGEGAGDPGRSSTIWRAESGPPERAPVGRHGKRHRPTPVASTSSARPGNPSPTRSESGRSITSSGPRTAREAASAHPAGGPGPHRPERPPRHGSRTSHTDPRSGQPRPPRVERTRHRAPHRTNAPAPQRAAPPRLPRARHPTPHSGLRTGTPEPSRTGRPPAPQGRAAAPGGTPVPRAKGPLHDARLRGRSRAGPDNGPAPAREERARPGPGRTPRRTRKWGCPGPLTGPGQPHTLRRYAPYASFVRFGPAPPAACSTGGTSGSADFSSPRNENFFSSPSPSVSTTTM